MFLFVIFINCIQLYNNQIHKNKGIYLYKDFIIIIYIIMKLMQDAHVMMDALFQVILINPFNCTIRECMKREELLF